MSRGICHNCIQFPAAQSRLVYAHNRPHILSVQDPILRVITLGPVPEVTEYLLILARQVGSVHPVMGADRTYAFGRGINPFLLKNPRTPESAASLPPPVHSHR